MSAVLSGSSSDSDHRARLLEGMASAVSEKRYGEITVADVVRHARVSKRTFYENFPDKEACFLATYQAVSLELMARIASAATEEPAGEAQLETATRAYFTALAERLPLVRAFLSEIHAAGPVALAMRREIHQRFATLLQALVARARLTRPEILPLSPDMATALVGAINELVLLHVEQGRTERLTSLTATATELIGLVLMRPAPAAPKHKPPKKKRTKA